LVYTPSPLILRGGSGRGLKIARMGREVDGIAVGIHPLPLNFKGRARVGFKNSHQ